MPPAVAALADFGHLLGAILGIGGLLYTGFVLLPAARELPEPERQALQGAARRRGRIVTYTAIALLLLTGLLKWLPATGGVGWLGHGGERTAFLHGKLVLALVVFGLALQLTLPPAQGEAPRRLRKVRVTAALGLVVVLLAVLHRRGVAGS
jgi:uncharacterized membrane protein